MTRDSLGFTYGSQRTRNNSSSASVGFGVLGSIMSFNYDMRRIAATTNVVEISGWGFWRFGPTDRAGSPMFDDVELPVFLTLLIVAPMAPGLEFEAQPLGEWEGVPGSVVEQRGARVLAVYAGERVHNGRIRQRAAWGTANR